MVLTKKQIFYDTDCLSSFLEIGDWSILEHLFDEITIPNAVYEEFTRLPPSSPIIKNLDILIDTNFVKIEDISPFSNIYDIYRDIRKEYEHNEGKLLGDGEAEAMALVVSKNGILASNNFRDIKDFVDKYEMALLTSAYMICVSVDDGFIPTEKASDTWNQMWYNGVNLPKLTFEEYYYDGQYESDYNDFGKRVNFK